VGLGAGVGSRGEVVGGGGGEWGLGVGGGGLAGVFGREWGLGEWVVECSPAGRAGWGFFCLFVFLICSDGGCGRAWKSGLILRAVEMSTKVWCRRGIGTILGHRGRGGGGGFLLQRHVRVPLHRFFV